MSVGQRCLKFVMRNFEKPMLRRTKTPQSWRRRMELQGRILFPYARGVTRNRRDIAGVNCLELRPEGADAGKMLLYLHGGAFCVGSAQFYARLAGKLAQSVGCYALVPDYRLAPEHPFPAAADDVYAVYIALLDAGVAASAIMLAGDSAGGNLLLGLVARLDEEKRPLPAALLAMSPLTDMSGSSPSFAENRKSEHVLPAERMAEVHGFYHGEMSPKDPRLSPVYARFERPPRLLIQYSTSEILADDARRMAAHWRKSGGEVQLSEYHDTTHVWQIFDWLLPEARAAIAEGAAFLRRNLG